MFGFLKRSVAFFTGRKAVWLKDKDGECVMSIAKVDPWGDLVADRKWPHDLHFVTLLDDGHCHRYEGTYVRSWMYVTPIKNLWKIVIASAVVCAMIASCSVSFDANITREECPVIENSN